MPGDQTLLRQASLWQDVKRNSADRTFQNIITWAVRGQKTIKAGGTADVAISKIAGLMQELAGANEGIKAYAKVQSMLRARTDKAAA